MDCPIKFKYLELVQGMTQTQNVADQSLPGYELKDGNGYTVASGTSLANLFEYGLQVDANYELMHQFVSRGHLDKCKHLEDVDCDDTGPVQFALPPGMGGGTGGSGQGFIQ